MARCRGFFWLTLVWMAWGCSEWAMYRLHGAEKTSASGVEAVFASQTAEDFQRWGLWDTVPDRPGLMRRLDGPIYMGKPSCTIEDQSVSHDPRLVSPVFEIPEDRWLRVFFVVRSDRPQHFLTITVQYIQREGDRETGWVELPFTVIAGEYWRTSFVWAPPASVVRPRTPKGKGRADAPSPSFRHARLMVYPVLHGPYFGDCWAWYIRAGAVHLAVIRVEAMPAGFKPTEEDRRRWFEFSTQLLPKGGRPAASLDFLQEVPAGKRGPVRVHPDGYLVFSDGSPVRLWGVAWHEHYFHTQFEKQPQGVWKEEHERAIKTLSALGCNFVRWHGLGRGVWDARTGQFHQKRWEEVIDPALAMLSEQGFYHQMTLWFFSDLLMPRQSLPPEIRDDEDWHRRYPTYADYHRQKWAIFCYQPMLRRMLDLQEEIMRHENPHRKMRYVDDPSVVIVQPINEVSLCQASPVNTPLWDPSPPPDGRRNVLPEGVEKAFQAEWNQWLVKRFGSREKLLAAYPGLAEEWKALGVGDADPAKGNVPLPPLRHRLARKAKRQDGWWHRVYLDFVMERERDFYRDFAQRMRKLGYRNAVAGDAGGVWRQQLITHADLEVGYDCHHPYTDSEESGDFSFAMNNPFPLQTPDLFYECLAVHQWGKAAVVSEWGAGTVSQYRAMLPILVAVDSAMQQRSAIAEHSFGYPFMRWDSFLGVGPGFGNLIGDPGRIATYPTAAMLYRIPEAIQAPRGFAVQLFTDEDLATPVSGLQGSENAGQFFGVSYLAHMMRVRWARWDGQSSQVPPGDLLYFPITSGVGNLKALPADRKLFLVVPPEITHSGWQIVRPYERLESLYPGVRFQRGRYRLQVKLGNGYEGQRDVEGRLFVVGSLPSGATLIGTDEKRQVCWAFYDRRSLVVSDGAVLQDLIPAALDEALKQWGIVSTRTGLQGPWELVSSTGQVRRNWREGWIVVDSDYGQVLMGDLSRVRAGRYLGVSGKRQVGVVTLVPLEKKPIPQARRWLLTAVGRVANRDYQAVYSGLQEPYRLSGVRLQVGKGPAVCEPLQATAIVQGLSLGKVRVWSLNPDLTVKKPVSATWSKGQLQIPLEEAESLWLLIEGL